jgi:RNA polymerase sigma-70 factor (ECF subfamily)
MPEIDFEDSSLGPEASAILRESRATIKQAMQSLPKKYSICLDFYFAFGLKYREISSITGIPVNTIKSHVFRAKEALRETLRDFAEEVYHGM